MAATVHKDVHGSVTTPDGRTLCFSLFGQVQGTHPRKTVVYHHGFLSSRLEAALLHTEALELGIRIIAFDRPGCGESTHDIRGRTEATVARDVELILDHMECHEKVVMMGVSGGSPYAAASAALLSQRVELVVLLVPFAQLGGEAGQHMIHSMSYRSQRMILDILTNPLLVKIKLQLGRLLQYIPHGTLLVRLGGFSAVDIAAVSKYPIKAQALKQASRESVKWGISGAYRDLERMVATSQGLDQVAVPTVIFAGDADTVTPPVMAEFYQRQIEGSRLVMVEGEGHFMGFGRGKEILSCLLE